MSPLDDSCQIYETVSTFLIVMQKKPWPLFSRHGVYVWSLQCDYRVNMYVVNICVVCICVTYITSCV